MSFRFVFSFLAAVCVAGLVHGQNQSVVDSLEIALRLEKEPLRKVDILLQLASELQSNDSESALNYATHALDLSEAIEDVPGELRSMNILSEICFEKTELEMALDYSIKAKMIAEQLDDPLQLGHALYNMGKVYTNLGNYERSSELIYESLKLSEENDDQVTVIKALNSIGIVHHNQSNYKKALEYYSKALQKSQEIGYVNGISKGLNNVAAMYGTMGDYERAVGYLRDAINLNLESNNLDLLGVNFLNVGYYFQDIEQYDSAKYYYDKALNIYENLRNTSSIVSSKIFLAGFYFKVGDLNESKEIALQSLEESRMSRLKRFEYESAVLLRKIFFELQDSIQAYQYKVFELSMKDSLNIEESRTRLSALELQYLLEKEEQQKKTAQQRKDMISIIVVISLIFIIIVIVLLLGRMRIKARSVMLEKDKLEMNLELRNKELTANVMSIMKKNETLSQIANKLKSIQNEAVKDETRQAIRKIAQALNKAVEEEQWEEFEMRFKQVHNEFYNTLIDNFPNLSPQEQRLCAFLRLNMTSKEISEITGQRISTIEMARTRLRKKLGITNTQTNLITFLAQI